MRISDWSSDVCSSDLLKIAALAREAGHEPKAQPYPAVSRCLSSRHNTPHHRGAWRIPPASDGSMGYRRLQRSEEHTSALESLMRISYAVFSLKKKTTIPTYTNTMANDQDATLSTLNAYTIKTTTQ